MGEVAAGSVPTKAERVRQVFERHVGKVTKAMILEECPDISEVTVKRTLAELLQEGAVEKWGRARR